ncbi:MAG TPA: hypothetical protein ACQGQH_09465 [Xylella sp.]
MIVGGKRYGKGSSRENSPMAEHSAGIRLVIAESFERIYRQNAHNIGLLTSTDLGLVERIQRGEAIPLAEFTDGHDETYTAHYPCGWAARILEAAHAWQRNTTNPVSD